MKIALVIEQFNLNKGGQERSTLEIAELLAARGIDVSIITAEVENLPGNVKTRIVNLKIRTPFRFARFIQFARQARKRINKEGFDVVHAITPISCADVYQPRGGLIQETFERNLARRKGLAWLNHRMIGPNLRQRLVRRMEMDLAYRTNCQFLAVSDYVRRQCVRHLGLADDRISIIFNGVDLNRLPNPIDTQQRSHLRTILKIGDDQLAGVFAATNFKLKGLDVIIDSALLLKRLHPHVFPRFKFLISGPDKVRSFFNKISGLGLEDSFLFLGPTNDIGSLYHASDFLIHPTWYDPCSRVVLESLACGLPAITTQFNGAGELIGQGDCGFVMNDPGDPNELLQYWIRLLDSDLRKRFAKNALALRPRISMDHHVRQLVEFYQKVIKK
ncbi:MAG: glycosyltransferase family 4 protein [Phycisphaerae bacterium]